jgi:hypothetical protein
MVAQITAFTALVVMTLSAPTLAFAQENVSVERGLYVSVIGGCHDCHTQGYRESGGKIDAAKAMKGDATLGWRSPLGVAYAANLRLFAFLRDEDAFVNDMKGLPETLPPMPWYNVRAMDETDLRSLYRYLMSLGEPGKPVPLPSHEEPMTPYITIDPPTMPKG